MKNVYAVDLKANISNYGNLVPLETNHTVPFSVKRVYYIYGVPNEMKRGFHAHIGLHQMLICVHGSVKILTKTPFEEEIITLDSPTTGLYIGPMIWREMFDFTEDAVLLVLASEHYNEADYIRDYAKFAVMAKEYFKEAK